MSDKVEIYMSKNADTRSAKNNTSKDELLEDTLNHIQSVKDVGYWLTDKFTNQIVEHDNTKITYFDEFYEDFNKVLNGHTKDFKSMKWFSNRHLKERHHLNDRVPDDVNLLDILEMVIDCTCAGLTRSGNVYPIKISNDVLQKAIENTKNLIIDNVEVKEK